MLQNATLTFLKKLVKNNNKPWFDAHRNDYEQAKTDFEDFVQSLLDSHSKKDADLRGLTAKKCTFRINRDVRFSKNKSPYKNNFGASMDRGGKKSGFAGYYFHLEPGKSFAGGGLWMPSPENTKKVRQEIDYCYTEFKKIVTAKKFTSLYGDLYTGENTQLVKLPQGFEKDNPAAHYLRFKSWLAIKDIPDDVITSPDLIKITLRAFETLQPFNHFINRSIENVE
jgi:uncharacterized protein (TIGR02453 family)